MFKPRNTVPLVLVAILALAGITAASALASGSPIVETRSATAIHGGEATLRGTVNPNGALTKYWFEYGTTTAYGTRTAEATVNFTEPTKNVLNLNSHAKYHFRIVAHNSNGTTNGADEVFTTPSELPEVSRTTGVTLEAGGTVDLRGASGGVIVNCHHLLGSGEFTGTKSVVASFKLTECTLAGFGSRCHTAGAGLEEVKSEALTGTLAYISKANKEAGIVFLPWESVSQQGPKPTVIGTISCGSLSFGPVKGSLVLASIGPLNKEGSVFGIPFSSGGYENGRGETIPDTLEWTDVKGAPEGVDAEQSGSEAPLLKTTNPITIKG